ncbi:hypothetical protein R1flu_020423 [Riccia fluitans]|uniref:Uncharacterized protein n=1 Tax=Riccia fluitans TaxID=41844 RepID=A0ABD1ZMY7_9MARC
MLPLMDRYCGNARLNGAMRARECAVSKDGLLAIGLVAPSSLLDCCFAADGVGGSRSVKLRIDDRCGLKLPSP